MNDTHEHTDQGRTDRAAAQSNNPFVKLVDEGHEKSRLISATADILGDLCAADNPNHLDKESVGSLMWHVRESSDRLQEIIGELDNLYLERRESVQSDTVSDDTPDPLSAAAVEVAQHFDNFDGEQQDAIRRVMREFPL